jgi:DNA-binding transcriptional MerR regulator
VELIKIGELARRSGVPTATLKHYLREGLIQPAHKSGRTMSWYDASVAARVRTIKRLQREQFLPLDLIRKAVDQAGSATDDLAAAEAIAAVLEGHGGSRSRTRVELLERG